MQPREEIVITNLVERAVDGKISTINKRDHWQSVDYELEKIGPGRGLAVSGWQTGSLTIRLGVEGFYRISFITCYSKIRAKLTGERCFDECEPVFENTEKEGWFDAEEVVWREADLTGKELILDNREEGCLLAIRLTPRERDHNTSPVRWPMTFTNDGGTMWLRKHRTPDDLFEWNERVPQDSCVRVLIYDGVCGDNCLHFTEVGTEFGELEGEGWIETYRTGVNNLRQYHEWNINPAEAMVEYAHQRGWEMYFYVRHRGWGDAWPLQGPFASRFYLEHPEFRNVGPNSQPVMGLSVAYPEVREHLCKLYAELASFGADGVCVCFIRGCPVVLYEPAMINGFKTEHGADPRKLQESDPRWLDYSASVVTTFMNELKEAVGPGCKLSAMVHGTQGLNRRFGLDIARWMTDGIVSDLFIMGHQYDKRDNHSQGGPDDLEFEYFQGLPGRQHVRLWPMFYMWQAFDADPVGHCDALQGYCDAGADGYGFWDAAAHEPDKRSIIWELGKELRPRYQKRKRLLGKYERVSFCGYMWNRYTPIEGW